MPLDLEPIRARRESFEFTRQDIDDLIAEVERLRAAIHATHAAPDYASLPALIRAIEARWWLWECGHTERYSPNGRFYTRVWTPNLDPLHYDSPAAERWGYGETPEEATQRAIDLLPTKAEE